MNKKLLSLIISLCLITAPLYGCSSKNENQQNEQQSTVQSANTDEELLANVINEIYSKIDNPSLSDATDDMLQELFFLNPDDVESYAVRYTDFKYGVSDVMIIKPKADKKQNVVSSLETRKKTRIAECENYDIHNSYEIAQKAEIYERGGYVIMLMLEDNASAKKIIERYIV